jgi:glycosyltransferase involved in cell wall biosynthesis
MPEPTFSIVMPAFNTASMIGAAIGSALAQTHGDFELLVVDDGSTDGTRDVVQCCAADARVKLLTAGPRGGPGAARNAAIAQARGTYVSMLDSDDLWLPTYLERAGEALDRNPSVGFVCAESWTLDDPPGLLRRPAARLGRRTAHVLAADELLRRLVRRNFVVNSTVTVRRSTLVAAGGCNSSLRAAVDFELWLRIAAAGYGAVFLPDPLAVYRVRRGSIQNEPRNELRANEALRLVYVDVAENWPVANDVKSVARSHVESIDRRIAVLTGKSPVRGSLLSARRRVGPLIRAVLGQRLWYTEPPGELGATLQELECGQFGRRLTHEPTSAR